MITRAQAARVSDAQALTSRLQGMPSTPQRSQSGTSAPDSSAASSSPTLASAASLLPPSAPPIQPPLDPLGPGRIYQQHLDFKALDKTDLKDITNAVSQYGVQAPYTLSCLDSMSYGGQMCPIEWRITARSALKPDQLVLWEAEFMNNCRDLARGNDTYFKQLSGSAPFDTIETQRCLPYELLSISSQAALKAWKTIPSSSAPTLPLSRIQQANDEPYHAFISRLLQAIDRTTGITDTSNPLVKQLAYENANSACRQILKGENSKRPLEEMISLCKDAHSFATQVAGALVAFQGQSSGKICYSCGQPGHFSGCCPQRRAPDMLTGSTSERPSLCPRCRRGRHWLRSCRATTDVEGNRLGANPHLQRQGNSQSENSSRGHPRAPRSKPRHINFVPASGAQAGTPSNQTQVLYQHHHYPQQQSFDPQPPPSSEPPPDPQGSICAPLPPTY